MEVLSFKQKTLEIHFEDSHQPTDRSELRARACKSARKSNLTIHYLFESNAMNTPISIDEETASNAMKRLGPDTEMDTDPDTDPHQSRHKRGASVDCQDLQNLILPVF